MNLFWAVVVTQHDSADRRVIHLIMILEEDSLAGVGVNCRNGCSKAESTASISSHAELTFFLEKSLI